LAALPSLNKKLEKVNEGCPHLGLNNETALGVILILPDSINVIRKKNTI
jgi:hypothetical protein